MKSQNQNSESEKAFSMSVEGENNVFMFGSSGREISKRISITSTPLQAENKRIKDLFLNHDCCRSKEKPDLWPASDTRPKWGGSVLPWSGLEPIIPITR